MGDLHPACVRQKLVEGSEGEIPLFEGLVLEEEWALSEASSSDICGIGICLRRAVHSG